MRIRQSVCYPAFVSNGADLEKLFAAVKEIGFEAVEFWFRDEGSQEVVALAKRHDLVVASMCGHQSLTDGLNNPANHQRLEAELIDNIDFAADHGIPGLICLSGNHVPNQSEQDAIDACATILSRVAPRAERRGVNLNLELLNSKIDHPGYQCDHTAWGLAVIEKVASPRVKLLYDIYHMQIMEGDVIRTIRENIHAIGHFHTAGNPGRQDPDETQELNYAGICQAIADTGYAYYVGHEYKPKGDIIESLRKTFEICNRC